MSKRTTFNFIVDLFSFVTFTVLVLSGFVIKYMPHGGGSGRAFRGGRGPAEGANELWTFTHHQWGDIHFIISIVFIVLMLVHLILHWTWIKCYLKSLFIASPKECDN